mgnify:CR=1 FL=1
MSSELQFQQLIAGEWCGAADGRMACIIDPATEDVVREVPFGGRADAERAIEAAAAAFSKWSRTTAYERAAVLLKTASLIRERSDLMVPLNIAESGKTRADAKGDLLAAAALFEWYAEEAKRDSGYLQPSRRADRRLMILRQPLGVVGTITAWNFPAYNPARCWAAALAAGCTVVGRPSELTPLTAMAMASLLMEAGLPAGVLNLINGEPEAMAQAMLDHPACRKISFTGSTRVGRLLMDGASRTITRLGLELGGNAPVIILPDADIEAVAASAPMAKCRNVGQVCVSPQRFLVHASQRDRFLDAVVPRMAALRVGPGTDPATDVGPMITRRHRDRVEELVDDARAHGASVKAGGRRPEGALSSRGNFYLPTVITEVGPETRILNEEIFGPIMPVTTFESFDEAIELANSTPYGLAAYVWTRDLRHAMRAIEGLEFGLVGVNDWAPQAIEAPFPGWKQSGLGRECGREGLEDYQEIKTASIGGLG